MSFELSARTQIALRLTLFIGFTFLVGFALYRFFFASTPSIVENTPSNEEQITGGSLPGSNNASTLPGGGTTTPGGSGQLPASQIANGGKTITTQLTNSPITSPHLTPDGNITYYDPADGRFYTIDENGEVVPRSLAQFSSVEEVTFSPSADAAILEFPDGSNLVYNFETTQQVPLPSHWEDFSFSANGSEIASKSIGTDSSNRVLVITAADGSSTQTIAALGNNDDKVTVSWSPAESIVGFSATGSAGDSAFGQSQIYTIGKDGEANGIITVNGTNYSNIWSPSGKYILYSIADSGDEYRPSLWYVDAKGDRNGDTRMRLSVKTTVDRCTFFNESTLYCGIPVETPMGSGGNPEILTGPDHLYKISVPSGKTELIAIPTISTVLKNLSVSSDETSLYYTDEFGKLHMIRLK